MNQQSLFQVKALISLIFLTGLFSCSDTNNIPVVEFKKIKDGFITPADTNMVWCYWYWLNDDISKEGVTKDLEAMKEVGIGGAFIGNINPDEVDGRIPLFSDQWWEIMVHAVNEGKRLGVDIGVFNCPGWSQSGGPWVKPQMAMRYLTYSETRVTGGKMVTAILPEPGENFQDVTVLAYPDPDDQFKSASLGRTSLFQTNTGKSFSMELESSSGMCARTLLLYPAGAQLKTECEVFARQGREYKLIKSFLYDRSNNSLSVGPDIFGPLAIALPGVVSQNFRITIKNPASNQPEAGFRDVVITEEVRLEKYVEKQLGKMHPTPFPEWGTYLWDLQDNGSGNQVGIPAEAVIDLTTFMDTAGVLHWDAPAGDWIVMRTGMTPTGTRNSPAAPQGKGYEIDKANSGLAAYHFDHYVGELLRRIPSESLPALKYVIADSYEMGSQNWTDQYEEKFRKRYGYDPLKYFPVLSGRIVGSTEESERFLWDLRRSVADDIAYEYVGGLRKISEENNLKIWLENYGHWGFPSEFLMYGGQSSLVGGEFWNEGELGNIECKAASSSAHIYGKPVTSAEAFTAAGNSYGRYPGLLKRRGDWSYTEGINHFVVHVYIHQPDDKRIPGINAWFSTEFNRHNTWFARSKSWFDYLRRCQHLLQQGKYAADVCYFIGEDAPKMTGARIPELPSGYSCDYMNAEVILSRLTVQDGRFVLPDGMSYRIMVLPPLQTIRPELLEKLKSLVLQGGIILGPKPLHSPSLEGYPDCDEQVGLIADELWGPVTANGMSRAVGRGYVLSNMDLRQALEFAQVAEDFNPEGKFPVLWTHRTRPGLDIYFLTNQGNEKVVFKPSFRVTGKKPQLWDAVSGEIRMLGEYADNGVRTWVPVTLEPGQSWFIVFSDHSTGIPGKGAATNFPGKKEIMKLAGPWKVNFLNKAIGPDQPVVLDTLADLCDAGNDSIRFYSGTMVYSHEFDLDRNSEPDKIFIDLGGVSVIARIKVNGNLAGSLWMYPWTLEIGHMLRTGKNLVEVEVANLWRNRLIHDNRLPAGDRYTWTLISDFRADEKPPSSGLCGPVTLKAETQADTRSW